MPRLTLYFKCPTYGVRELLVTPLRGSGRGAARGEQKKRRKKKTEEKNERRKKTPSPGEMIQGIGESREANKVGAISKGGGCWVRGGGGLWCNGGRGV